VDPKALIFAEERKLLNV